MKQETDSNRSPEIHYRQHTVPQTYQILDVILTEPYKPQDEQWHDDPFVLEDHEYHLEDYNGLTPVGRYGNVNAAGNVERGKVRKEQEDTLFMKELKFKGNSEFLGIIADGHLEQGKRASCLAVMNIAGYYEAFRNSGLDVPHALQRAMKRTNGMLYKFGFHTTATAAVISGQNVWVGNAGDSRAYIANAREDTISRITNDQSYVWEELIENQGNPQDIIYKHPRSSDLVGSLGILPPRIDMYHDSLLPGERFVLCSDGVWMMAGNNGSIGDCATRGTPEDAVLSLSQLAMQKGGYDNMSAIVVEQAVPVEEELETKFFVEEFSEIPSQASDALLQLRQKVEEIAESIGWEANDMQSFIEAVLDGRENVKDVPYDNDFDDGGCKEKLKEILEELTSFGIGRHVIVPYRNLQGNLPFSEGIIRKRFAERAIVSVQKTHLEYDVTELQELNSLSYQDIDMTDPNPEFLLFQTIRRRGGILINDYYSPSNEALTFLRNEIFIPLHAILKEATWLKSEIQNTQNQNPYLLIPEFLINNFPQVTISDPLKDVILEIIANRFYSETLSIIRKRNN